LLPTEPAERLQAARITMLWHSGPGQDPAGHDRTHEDSLTRPKPLAGRHAGRRCARRAAGPKPGACRGRAGATSESSGAMHSSCSRGQR
jgi:hypothetical protein